MFGAKILVAKLLMAKRSTEHREIWLRSRKPDSWTQSNPLACITMSWINSYYFKPPHLEVIYSRVVANRDTNYMIKIYWEFTFRSDQSLSRTLCDPMNRSTPGLPVHHQLPEFTQTHVHRVSDAIQPSHPLSSPSPPAPNPSQHQSLFQWVNTSHEVAKVLEFQL